MIFAKIEKRLLQIFITFSLVYLLYSVRGILMPFVVGFVLAYFFSPMADRLEKRMPRALASFLIVSMISLIFLIVFFIVAPLLFYQAIDITKSIVNYISNMDEKMYEKINNILLLLKIDGADGVKAYLESYSDQILKYFAKLLNKTLSSSIALINVVTLIFIIPVAMYYFLKSWNDMVSILKNILPASMADKTKELLKQIDDILHAYISGQVNVCLFFIVYYIIFFNIIDLKIWLFASILAGCATLIPTLGGILAGMITLLGAYFQWGFDFWRLFIVLALIIIAGLIENIVTPKFVGSKINLNPLWIIFALFVGGSLMGFTGMILALPMASIIGVVVRFFMKQYSENNAKRLIDR